MNEDANRLALGRLVKRERLAKFKTVDKARAVEEVSRGAWDSVEAGRKVKDFTLASVEKTLGYRPGSFQAMIDGSRLIPGETYSMSVNDPGASVGTPTHDVDTLLFKRPDGLSDEEWDDLKARERDHWEWLIERASRER